METEALEARLLAALARHRVLAVAISGGVDSMTLAVVAHRHMPSRTVSMIHAVSPAVPVSATDRVRARAGREGWQLTVTDAGEFGDVRYRSNPVNRCYFCKVNLYDRIRGLTQAAIASGSNLDDLGEYRPGLLAASERDVVHPYIEASIGKAEVRVLARHHGLHEVAELPAQPCLASRVETGIAAITAADLAFADAAETGLSTMLPAGATVRCRVTGLGIVIKLEGEADPAVADLARALCAAGGRRFVGVRPYRRGAAFLRGIR